MLNDKYKRCFWNCDWKCKKKQKEFELLDALTPLLCELNLNDPVQRGRWIEMKYQEYRNELSSCLLRNRLRFDLNCSLSFKSWMKQFDEIKK
jgi:hypothetical protein